mgnify:CR=1 FL=1
MNDFTDRELEIVKLLCLPNAEISKRLFITPATVQTHIENIRHKVDSTSRAGILIELIKSGVIDIEEIILY